MNYLVAEVIEHSLEKIENIGFPGILLIDEVPNLTKRSILIDESTRIR